MDNFGGFCPVEIHWTSKQEMIDRLCGYEKGSNTVLFLDASLAAALTLEELIEKLRQRYSFTWIKKISANPTQQDVLEALECAGRSKPDRLIAIGGGSTMDLAKAFCALYGDYAKGGLTVEGITEIIRQKSYCGKEHGISLITVATTAGTGSELTKWATIWDVDKKAKFSVDDSSLYATETLVTPELLYHSPNRLVLSTGLDAFCQALESFWAKPATPVSRAVSVTAMETIVKHLKNALWAAGDEKYAARDGMLLGSTLAGIAFSNTRTTACHSISYPLTMSFGVEHGFACALTLNEVMKRNRDVVPEIGELMEHLFGDRECGLEKWLEDVTQGIQNLKLSAFGIPETALAGLAERAFTAGRMNNNPIEFQKEEVEAILHQVY
ncbi:MAG: phosphonoacetaldehyde reductase [Lachnospiraceae bacterium]|nr:phosphonoacetaldehyde reductase [Lachnospiraceae bacterium]